MTAEKPPSGRRQPAKLNLEECRDGIVRLTKRLDELKAFDPQTVQDRRDPRISSLEAGITTTIATVFGTDTVEYYEYAGAGKIDKAGFNINGMPLSKVIEGLVVGRARAIALLEQAIRSLQEEAEIQDQREWSEQLAKSSTAAASPSQPTAVFIVHGRDNAAKHEVARFIQDGGLEPIILHEQPNAGRTIIEKFEQHSAVGFAVILMTPDDLGGLSVETLQPRARQNVIAEMGFFAGSLGRSKVCVLKKGDVEEPSDFHGVVYTVMDERGAWKQELARELLKAELPFDAARAMGLR